MELILASTSPYRRQLLQRLGLPFRAVAPRIDEEACKDPGLTPLALAETLAAAKATSLCSEYPQATLLGSDQVAHCEGTILGKPGTREAAVAQLVQLSGREHELITALVVCHQGELLRHTDVTRLRMRDLTPEELARYVAADLPLDCAGSYKLEARGIALFEEIVSADQSAITGLPLIGLTTILRELGYAIP